MCGPRARGVGWFLFSVPACLSRLMELGHLEELKQIFSYLPRSDAKGNHRQSLLFSATVTEKVKGGWRIS